MIMSDIEIIERAKQGMIEPFIPESVSVTPTHVGKAISYGLSSYGYDARVRDEFLIYHNAYSTFIDPKDFDERSFIKYDGKGYAMIPPNSFALCETVEYFRIPRDCLPWVAAKSTYARCGLLVNSTVLEPEWEGRITLELSNSTPLPVKVYAGEGIVQIVFLKSDRMCQTSYADRKGKYQKQIGVTPPRM